jgi:lipoprotein-anchoring transpeptidase ErfK/SrfK
MLRRVLVFLFLVFSAAPALAAAPLSITVDLSQQKMTVRMYGDVAYVWPVSTGAKGYRTPTGSYRPVRMYEEYYSKKYDDAPMPYSIFYSGGFAIHGTSHLKALGRPASHGCVRLHPGNAALLFDLVREFGRGNTSIRIKS